MYIAVVRTDRIESGLLLLASESAGELEDRTVTVVAGLVGWSFENIEDLRWFECQDDSDLAVDFFEVVGRGVVPV